MIRNSPIRPLARPARGFAAATAVLGIALLATACSSSGGGGAPSSSGTSSTTTSATQGGSPPSGSGPVNVLYAGSLVDLMEQQVGPAFKTATGYTLSGYSDGSTDLAAAIKGKVRQGDVFVSASPSADQEIMGAKNGGWVKWYATIAKAPLVLGYNPQSKFAAQLKTKPWYDVITEPGFRLGKTDPATDPKGELAVEALDDIAKSKHLPALKDIAKSSDGVYPEETLVGRLQSGQLDAGFFYSAEATAAHIRTVPLTGTDLAATYTVSILTGAPHEAGAVAFVKYFLGSKGLAVLKQDGFDLVSPPTVTGSGVPSGLSSVLPK